LAVSSNYWLNCLSSSIESFLFSRYMKLKLRNWKCCYCSFYFFFEHRFCSKDCTSDWMVACTSAYCIFWVHSFHCCPSFEDWPPCCNSYFLTLESIFSLYNCLANGNLLGQFPAFSSLVWSVDHWKYLESYFYCCRSPSEWYIPSFRFIFLIID